MSMWRLTDQTGETINKPGKENGKKTIRVFTKDDPGNPGTLVVFSKDSDDNDGDFKGPKGDQGDQGIQGNTGAPGTLSSQSVTTLANPIEIEGLTLAAVGADLLAKQSVGAGGADRMTFYIYDLNGPAKNAPYVMNTGDGGTTRWVAVAGEFVQAPGQASNGDRFMTAAEIIKLTGLGGPKEKIFSFGNDTSSQDTYANRSAGSTAQSFVSGTIPVDFNALVSIDLLVFYLASAVLVDIDFNSSYALKGQDRLFNAESDLTGTFSWNANEIAEHDVSSVFNSLAAGQAFGLNVDHNSIGTTGKYLGLRLRYT